MAVPEIAAMRQAQADRILDVGDVRIIVLIRAGTEFREFHLRGDADAIELDRPLQHGAGTKHNQLVRQHAGSGSEETIEFVHREYSFYRLVAAR